MTFKFDACPKCKNPRYLRGKPCVKCGYRPPSFWQRIHINGILREIVYILLGILAPGLSYLSLFSVLYLAEQSGLLNLEGIAAIGLLLSLAMLAFTIYCMSLGKYGNITISHILVIILWAFIPLLNLTLFYYLGKGLHQFTTKPRT